MSIQDFVRDKNSGMIINNNIDQYNAMVKSRERMKEAQLISEKLQSIETEVHTIKTLLLDLINERKQCQGM